MNLPLYTPGTKVTDSLNQGVVWIVKGSDPWMSPFMSHRYGLGCYYQLTSEDETKGLRSVEEWRLARVP